MAILSFIGESSQPDAIAIGKRMTRAGHEALFCKTIDDILHYANSQRPDFIIVNAALIPGNGYTGPLITDIAPTIAYAIDLSEAEKLSLYEKGVRKIVTSEDGLPERLEAAVRMVNYRSRQLWQQRQQALVSGFLHSLSLADTFYTGIVEHKNLIFKIHTPSWDARIRMFRGHITESQATCGEGIDGTLRALMLDEGMLTIRRYEKPKELSEFGASTLAVLSEAARLKAKLQSILGQYIPGSPNPAIYLRKQAFAHLPLDSALTSRGSNIQYTISDLILFSHLSLAETIDCIGTLFARKLIVAGVEPLVRSIFMPKDLETLAQSLMKAGQAKAVLPIIGFEGTGVESIIAAIAQAEGATVQSLGAIEFAQIRLPDQKLLTVMGIRMDSEVLTILNKVSGMLAGVILLVDPEQRDRFEFVGYLLNQLNAAYRVPMVGGELTNLVPRRAWLPEGIGMDILGYQSDSVVDIRSLFMALRPADTRMEEGGEDD